MGGEVKGKQESVVGIH